MTTAKETTSAKEISDRELDDRTAIEAMEWHQATDYDYKPPQVNWVDASGEYQAIVNCPEQLENILPWSFRPSTDIASAMLVVEKMRERGFGVTIDDMMGSSPWRVSFDNGSQSGNMRDESLPKAICLAALEATKETGG